MSAQTPSRTGRPLLLNWRSALVLTLVSLVGLAMFVWPLFAAAQSDLSQSADAPLLFAVVMALLVIVLANELMSGQLDAKALAMLGVLAAAAAALRPLGSGVSGFQPMFVVLILGGRALGPGFGFCLGLVGMFASALLTGGVGPWLPFQMLGAAWVGMGAGLLPRCSGRREVGLLIGYGVISAVLYGFLLNLWFWPFLVTGDSTVAFVPGDELTGNLGRFLAFCLVTSLGFDIPRAIGNVILIALVGGPGLRAIRRATRKAHFDARPTFLPAPGTTETSPETDLAVPAAGDVPAGQNGGGGTTASSATATARSSAR